MNQAPDLAKAGDTVALEEQTQQAIWALEKFDLNLADINYTRRENDRLALIISLPLQLAAIRTAAEAADLPKVTKLIKKILEWDPQSKMLEPDLPPTTLATINEIRQTAVDHGMDALKANSRKASLKEIERQIASLKQFIIDTNKEMPDYGYTQTDFAKILRSPLEHEAKAGASRLIDILSYISDAGDRDADDTKKIRIKILRGRMAVAYIYARRAQTTVTDLFDSLSNTEKKRLKDAVRQALPYLPEKLQQSFIEHLKIRVGRTSTARPKSL